MRQEILNNRMLGFVIDNDLESAERFIGQGAALTCCDSDGWTALHHASLRGYLHIVHYFVEQGIDIDAKETECHYTPLHLAIQAPHLHVIQFLVEHGADMDITDKNGNDVFDLAKKKGKIELFEFLMTIKENNLLDKLIENKINYNQNIEF